ncbi:MAG: YfhO family protein, partial [Anaerolineae bacterium]|nr:YfhO family protein [Anaerolineae bacterium]
LPDRLRLEALSSAAGSRVLVVQQLAHPGWQVSVDGSPAYLESVGGLIGVLLPRDSQKHSVEFAYRPPLVYRGGVLTLFTCGVLSLYLLRADRLLKILRHKKGKNHLDQTGQDTIDENAQPDEG